MHSFLQKASPKDDIKDKNKRQKWNRFTKVLIFLFQNVKFQRISAVKQEGSIVAGQKDNCADVAARSQFGDYSSVD